MSFDRLKTILSDAGLEQVHLVETAYNQIIQGSDFSGELPSHPEHKKDFLNALRLVCDYCDISGKVLLWELSFLPKLSASFLFGEAVYEAFRFTLDDNGSDTLVEDIESCADRMFSFLGKAGPLEVSGKNNDVIKDKCKLISVADHAMLISDNYRKLFLATIYALFDEKTRNNIALDLCTIIASCSSFMVYGVNTEIDKIYCIKR